MARTLSQLLANRTGAALSEPRWLLRLGPHRFCDADDDLVFDGETWAATPGLEVGRVVLSATGAPSGTVRLPVAALPAGVDAVSGDLDDLEVGIWLAYRPTSDHPGAIEGVRAVRGFVDRVTYRPPHWIEVALGAENVNAATLPRIRIAPPVFRHLPSPGEIVWANDRLKIEAD